MRLCGKFKTLRTPARHDPHPPRRPDPPGLVLIAARLRAALLIIGLGTLVVPMDTAVNVAFPAITQAFEIPVSDIQWIITMFGLAQVSLTMVFGRLGDRYGHRRVFITGLLTSALAFTLCATAWSYPSLVLMRSLQGIGAGLVMACGPALVTVILPASQRRQALAFYTMLIGLGMFLGPFLGGLLVQFGGWPAVYWVRVPMALLAALLIWQLHELENNPALMKARATARLKPMDVSGLVATVLCLTAFVFVIVQIREQPFGLTALIGTLATALISLRWLFHQSLTATDPVLNIRLFREPGFAALQAAAVFIQAMTFSLLLLMPYRFIDWPGIGIAQAGFVLAAFPGGMVIAAMIGTRLSQRLRSHALLWMGMLLASAGLMGCAWFSLIESLPLTMTAMLLTGFGQGIFQVGHLDATVAAMPLGERGVAGSLVSVDRVLGFSLSANGVMWLHDILRDGQNESADYFRTLLIVGAALGVAGFWFAARASKAPVAEPG
ncbi:MAG: MFS transporter [Burkholderiaceae bacterium]